MSGEAVATSPFEGTARFEVRRRIGAGGFGVVYEAFDRHLGQVVALKTLKNVDPEAIYRFKREFRVLADLAHPNLLNLYELLWDKDRWFFTMELVEGTDFLQHVRGESFEQHRAPSTETLASNVPSSLIPMHGGSPICPPPDRISTLRAALRQLANGLQALHAAGKLHRDIKPSNVRVSKTGRVVLLDFGLATELDNTQDQGAFGTPPYMSPERSLGWPLTPASDWYSVGLMLYECLTGTLPSPAALPETGDPHLAFDPESPGDLQELCLGLLRRDSSARLTGEDLLRRLSPAPLPRGPSEVPFVGRVKELRALRSAYEATRAGSARTLVLRGASGIGKTMLAHHFVEGVRSSERIVFLEGRCYERESVPEKALDSLVDSLSRYLAETPDADKLLPSEILALARLFPVLKRVPAVALARRKLAEISDLQEMRRRAILALKELFASLASRENVILFIDDLHWGDEDSIVLLKRLINPPDPPPLLLLVSCRSDSSLVESLLDGASTAEEVPISPLSAEEALQLAQGVLGASEEASVVARECRGNPLFLMELARDTRPGARRITTLETMLLSRIEALPEATRKLLEVVAVAGHPIPLEVALEATPGGPAGLESISLLRAEHLLRTRGTADALEVEALHDDTRKATLARLDEGELRGHHRALARVLEGRGGDAESLAGHLRAAGEREGSFHYAVQAAEQALETLAFDRASRLFRLALALEVASTAEAGRLHKRLAQALANAGRGAEAAVEYLAAAQGATAAEAVDLKRMAGEQFLVSGRIDEGKAVLDKILMTMGLRIPSPRRALVSLVARRAYLRLRGSAYKARDASQVSALRLSRIDLCWAVAMGLAYVDTIPAAAFATRHLLLALRAGEPRRLVRAFCLEAFYSATGGIASAHKTRRLLAKAAGIAGQIQDARALALVSVSSGVTAYLEGEWAQASRLLAAAEEELRRLTDGATVTWELNQAQIFALMTLFSQGDLAALAKKTPAVLREADERSDLFLYTCVRTRTAYVLLLAADCAEEAQSQVDEAIARWPAGGFQLQHVYHLLGKEAIRLYRGECQGIWGRIREQRGWLAKSQLMRIQATRIRLRYLWGTMALVAPDNRHEALVFADRQARLLSNETAPWGHALGTCLSGGVLAARGRASEAASTLATAAAALDTADLRLHAAAARRRRGELVGGAEGRALVNTAETLLASQGVRDPQRFSRMFLPEGGSG